MFKSWITKILLLFALVSCGQSDDKLVKDSSSDDKENSSEASVKQEPSLEVSTSAANSSKPLSNYEGSAKDKKNDELYVVPNQFPEKEALEEDNKKENPPE